MVYEIQLDMMDALVVIPDVPTLEFAKEAVQFVFPTVQWSDVEVIPGIDDHIKGFEGLTQVAVIVFRGSFNAELN